MDTVPGEDLESELRELLDAGGQEVTERVRQMGGLLPLTDEQSEALGAAVLLLAQGDTESQLDLDFMPPAPFNAGHNSSGNADRHAYAGMYS